MASPSPAPAPIQINATVQTNATLQTPAPHFGTKASDATYGQQVFMWWLVVALFVGAAVGSITTILTKNRKQATYQKIASLSGFFVCIICMAGHVIFIDVRADEKFIPNFDQTALIWLCAAVGSLLFPFVRLSKLNLGSFGAEIDTTENAEKITKNVTKLFMDWWEHLKNFLAEKDYYDDPEHVRAFMQIISDSAVKWLGTEGEEIRLSVWVYDARNKSLEMFFDSGIHESPNQPVLLKNGQGIVGEAYRLQTTINVAHPEEHRSWYKTPSDPSHPKGAFATPITFSRSRLGVLCLYTSEEKKFSKRDSNVILALANFLGVIMRGP